MPVKRAKRPDIIHGATPPTAREYAAGLAAIASRISPLQRRILLTHYEMPGHAATAGQIARAASVPGGHPVININYARLARRLFDALGRTPGRRGDGSIRWWTVWSTGHRSPSGFVWQMLPEVVTALVSLGWHAPAATPLAEEVVDEVLVEGSVSRITINAFERNPVARERCIAHYGARCVACDFDFGMAYGSDADGYIHVHHLLPLAEISTEYVVDPIEDLRPVCPNCHAFIHLGGETRSIETVKALLEGMAKDGEARSSRKARLTNR